MSSTSFAGADFEAELRAQLVGGTSEHDADDPANPAGFARTHVGSLRLLRFARDSRAHVEAVRTLGTFVGSAMVPQPMTPPQPSFRKLAGIALILLLIVLWAAFVASLAQVVGRWPILVQAPYYLFMGVAWVIPLKPLVRWMETGSFRVPDPPRN